VTLFEKSDETVKAAGEATRRLVDEISAEKKRPVEAKDIAHKLGISKDKAYAKLRYAVQAGVIQQANKPQKDNRKAYLSMPRPRFVPDPEKLFQKLKGLKGPVRFVHASTQILPTYVKPLDENTRVVIEALDAARRNRPIPPSASLQ